MTGKKNKFIYDNLCEMYEMEKIPKILKLQAKVNQVFHSTVIK